MASDDEEGPLATGMTPRWAVRSSDELAPPNACAGNLRPGNGRFLPRRKASRILPAGHSAVDASASVTTRGTVGALAPSGSTQASPPCEAASADDHAASIGGGGGIEDSPCAFSWFILFISEKRLFTLSAALTNVSGLICCLATHLSAAI